MKIPILLLLLLPFSVFCQGEFKIKGYVKDVETDLPIERASIQLKNSKIVEVTNKYGYFEITASKLPATLKITHICYNEIKITVDASDTVGLEIKLKYKVNLLKAVDINDKSVEKISRDENLWAFDYEFFKKNILILNLKSLRSNSFLHLVNFSGDTVSTLDLKDKKIKPLNLFKDCLGNVHVVTKDSAYQVLYSKEKGLELKFPTEINKFEYLLSTCVTSIDSLVYYQYYDYHSFISQCYYINMNKKDEQKTIWTIIDSTTLGRFEREFDRQHYVEIKRACMIIPSGVTDEELRFLRYVETINGRYFFESAYPPLYTPLINIHDTLCIFNHLLSQIEFFSGIGHFIKKVSVDYHQSADWVKCIIYDHIANKVYAQFLNEGIYALKEISLMDGSIKKTIQLPDLPYIEAIKAYDNYIYFLYRSRAMGIEDNKMLYRMKIG